MPKLILDITMSLDGYATGPDPTLEEPLGRGGEELHEWVPATASWQESHGRPEEGETNADDQVVAEHVGRIGATIMGRRMFSNGEGPWEDDPKATGGGATSRRSGTRCSC